MAVYLGVRGGAAALFVASATVVPRGTAAGLLAMLAGVIAVLSCIGVNAGGPGERAGAVAGARAMDEHRAPQGDWPPFPADKVVDGELVGEPVRGRLR